MLFLDSDVYSSEEDKSPVRNRSKIPLRFDRSNLIISTYLARCLGTSNNSRQIKELFGEESESELSSESSSGNDDEDFVPPHG